MTVARSLMLPLIAAAMLFSANAAVAAPTCQTPAGETARCGTPGAMPVGWTLPYDQRPELTRHTDTLSPAGWFALVALVGGLFALFALMPPFDRWGDTEEDGEEPR